MPFGLSWGNQGEEEMDATDQSIKDNEDNMREGPWLPFGMTMDDLERVDQEGGEMEGEAEDSLV